MRRVLLLAALLALAEQATGCTYDYSGVRLVETPPVDGGGSGTDAGSRFTCDPITQTCGPMLHCAMISDTSAQLSARCVIAGTGTASAGCDGPEDCAPGFYCHSTASGSTTCQSFCSDAAPTCADARTCDTASELFAIGSHTGHPCR